MRLAVSCLKGGVGKSASVWYLSEVAARSGSALVIDTDAQGSVSTWAKLAEQGGEPHSATVIASSAARLKTELPKLGAQYAHVILDTPPTFAGEVTTAMQSVDLVLIPTSADPADLLEIGKTAKLAERSGVPAVMLLTKVFREGKGSAEVVEYLRSMGYRVLDTVITRRAGLAQGVTRRPVETWGYERVWQELMAIEEGR